MRIGFFFFIALLCAGPLLASAQDFQGRCVGVPSGDTLEVLKGPRRLTVHLAGVAALEPAQPFAEPARKALAATVLDRTLVVTEKFTDRAGVIHALVAAPDSTVSLNAAMIAGGLAWCDPATRLVRGLDEAERQARAAGRGLWAEAGPIPPWEWRQRSAAGTLPAPAPPPAEKMQTESAFDRLIKIPNYGDGQDGLVKTVVEARRRQDAIEENARQAAIYRRQQAVNAYNYYGGMDSYYGYDPYMGMGLGYSSGGLNFSSRRTSSRSSSTGTYGSGSWTYLPQASSRTTPYGTIFTPNFNYSLQR